MFRLAYRLLRREIRRAEGEHVGRGMQFIATLTLKERVLFIHLRP